MNMGAAEKKLIIDGVEINIADASEPVKKRIEEIDNLQIEIDKLIGAQQRLISVVSEAFKDKQNETEQPSKEAHTTQEETTQNERANPL